MTGSGGAILVTRPAEAAARTAKALADLDRPVLIWPLTVIRPTGAVPALPEGCAGVIATSAHSFDTLAPEQAARITAAVPVAFCVGRRTAEAARAVGFARVESADGDSDDLHRHIAARAPGPLLYLRGRDTTGDLGGRLMQEGIRVNEAEVYSAEPATTIPREVDAKLRAGKIDVIGIWSLRNAVILAQWFARRADWDTSRVRIVAISGRAAAPIDAGRVAGVIVADRPDGAGMHDAFGRALASCGR